MLLNSLLKAHASFKSVEHCGSRNSKLSAPFSQIFSHSIMSVMSADSSVVRLLSRCGPPTILSGVVAIVIDAVKGMFSARLTPHVSIKVFKYIPSLTHGNTSTSIAFEPSVVRIVTSCLHVLPRLPLRCFRLIMSRAEQKVFSSKASAGAGMTILKAGPSGYDNIATSTYELPSKFILSVTWSNVSNGKTTERKANKIFNFSRHNILQNDCAFMLTYFTEGGHHAS